MVDQTSTTDEQTNSTNETETTTATSAEATSNTSATTQQKTDDDDESVDLGTGKKPDADESDDDDAGSTDTQEDTRTDEEKAADEERATLFGPPAEGESYQIEGLPDGTEIDKEALEAVTPAFRELGLSSKGASKVAQVYAEKVLPHVAKTVVSQLEADALAQRKTWENEARDAIAGKTKFENLAGDPISFDGKALPEVQKLAAKTLDRFAPVGFREWLDETGLGVHPMMIALAYNVGKEHAEDRELETTDTGSRAKKGDGRPMTDPSKYYNR